jgi:outer membrane lipoprotein LolB
VPHRSRLLLACILCLLAACASQRQPLPPSSAGIERFSLAGRVAVKVVGEGNAPDRGYSANLQWRHAPEADSLRLLSPVGSVIAELESGASGATLVTGERKVYRATDVQALTREVLGWDLPLAGLRHWVLGRPDASRPAQAEERDALGRYTRFSQDGWRIAYPAYSADSALPSRVTLSHERLNLRLVIDEWTLPG